MDWWQRLVNRNRLEHELDVELRYRFDQQVADYVRRGMSTEEARRRARAEFGGVDQVKEECRDARGTRWIEETVQDLRLPVRLLAKDRTFTIVAVITLALAIGVNTAMFSVIGSVLLTPLPYREPERMLWISENDVRGANKLAMVFAADVEEWRKRAASLEAYAGVMAITRRGLPLPLTILSGAAITIAPVAGS